MFSNGAIQYLGSTVTSDGGARYDLRSPTRKANAAFVQLYQYDIFQDNYFQNKHEVCSLQC